MTTIETNFIYDAMVTRFLKRVAEEEAEDATTTHKREYHWKWVGTSQLAEELNIKCSVLRNKLNQMEKLGLVHCERRSNWLSWAANKIEGFRQHKFKDYYCRTTNTTN